MLTIPEMLGADGFISDGDWVESKDQDPEGEVRLTQLADVGDGWFRDRSDRWMNDEQANRLNVTYLQPGDVLVARMPDPLGRACVVPRLSTRAVTVVDVCIVRAPGHSPKWLMHALNAPQTRVEVDRYKSGSTRKRISKKNLCKIPLPMPERRMQDAIVAAIETHFSRLDAAVASLTRAKANVQRARASVLKAAVEGRLVPTEAALARAEGRDYEPASALLARILTERKAAHEAAQEGTKRRKKYKPPLEPETEGMRSLPEGWCWASVDQLSVESLSNGKSVRSREGGFPVLRLTAMEDGRLNLRESKEGDWTADDAAPWLVEPGDFFIMRGNGSISRVGSAALAGDSVVPVAYPDTMIRFRPVKALTCSRYLLAAWSSLFLRGQIERSARTTAGIHKVNQSSVQRYVVPLPPLAEQHRIAAEVDRRLSVLDAIDTTLNANLARCERLRQSILKRAFEGRLVPAPGEPKPVADGDAEQLGLFAGATP